MQSYGKNSVTWGCIQILSMMGMYAIMILCGLMAFIRILKMNGPGPLMIPTTHSRGNHAPT